MGTARNQEVCSSLSPPFITILRICKQETASQFQKWVREMCEYASVHGQRYGYSKGTRDHLGAFRSGSLEAEPDLPNRRCATADADVNKVSVSLLCDHVRRAVVGIVRAKEKNATIFLRRGFCHDACRFRLGMPFVLPVGLFL